MPKLPRIVSPKRPERCQWSKCNRLADAMWPTSHQAHTDPDGWYRRSVPTVGNPDRNLATNYLAPHGIAVASRAVPTCTRVQVKRFTEATNPTSRAPQTDGIARSVPTVGNPP